MKYIKYAPALILLGGLFLFGCSGASKVESSFTNSGIKIDGDQSDWTGSLQTVKDDNVAYGFKNDGENLYLCLVTSDATKAMRILSMGMTVWLDPGNSKNELAVKFPLKPDPQEMRELRMQGGPDNGAPRDREKRIEQLISMQNELTVTDKDDLPLYTSELATAKDFQAALSYVKDQFVYELKVPLEGNKNAQTVLKTEPGENVQVKIETGKMDMQKRRGGGVRMGNGGGGGEGEGRRGGYGEGGGRRGGGGGERGAGRQNFKPLEYSFDVKLSK